MQKFIETLEQAEKIITTADHIVYVSYPLIKDKKILLKALREIKQAVVKCLNAFLQYEYLYKRIILRSDQKANLRTFQEKCAPRAGITPSEIKSILELFDLAERHEKSAMEFVRNEKIVILSESSEARALTLEKVKEFIATAKSVLKKIENSIFKKN